MPKANGSTEKVGRDDRTSARRRGSRASRLKWPYVVLVGVNVTLAGIICGWLLGRRAEGEKQDELPPIPAPTDALKTIARGDELLLSGKPDQAIALYELAAKVGAPSPRALSYRLAVAAEQAGDLDGAVQHYKSVDSYEASRTSFAAKLGQARIHLRKGNTDISAKLLAKMATVSATPVYASAEIGLDVDFLMGLVRSQQALAGLPKSPLDPQHLFGFGVAFGVERLLQLVPAEGSQFAVTEPIDDQPRKGIQLYGPARHPSTSLLSASFSNETVSGLLDSLAAATNWKISLTEIALEVTSAKRLDVRLRDKTAAELLSLVLEPHGLFWTYDGDTLVIDRIENSSRDVVATQRQKRAQRLLEIAIAAAPDHFLTPQAYLALGNLSALEGRHQRASAFYREVTERFRGRSVAQVARFNLAKILYLHEDVTSAIAAFYEVVDQREGTELEPLAYLYLGRIFFGQGELKKAKTELSRGIALARQPSVAATASLTLASVYLMSPDAASAGSANAVLMEHREALQHPPFRDQAIFLSALTRFRSAVMPGDVRRRRRELIAASVRVDPSSFFGDFGYLLVGSAFADLNINSETVRLYQEGLGRSLRGSLRDELIYRLAVEYREQGEFELAKEALLELSAGSSAKWAAKAAVELADLLRHTRRLTECIRHCRWSLKQEYPEQDNIALLRLLGRVYEELGDHKKAGICFAGFLPGEVTKIAEVTK